MSEQVPTVTELPTPSKALWKRGLKTVAVTAVIALGASAVYQGWKKGGEEADSTVETTTA